MIGEVLLEGEDVDEKAFSKISSPQKVAVQSVKIPEWLEEDDDFDDGAPVKDYGEKDNWLFWSLTSFEKNLSPLEALPPDLSAFILNYLNVQELSSIATLSKTMYQAARNLDLWRLKFEARWNYYCGDKGDDTMDWYFSYQHAYKNTHDLWITHLNCVEPYDGLGSGRCCIQPNIKSPKKDKEILHLCPTCRYQQPLAEHTNPTTTARICTAAQAVAAATSIRLQQSCTLIRKITSYCSRRAQLAFSNSSTLHRTIPTQQYQSNYLCFLSDLLFFQVHDDNHKELQNIEDCFGVESNPRDSSETALHSWHLVRFCNPDFDRPLVWRVSIQRQDCFCVYPSEGLLTPGESSVVVFGVRALGSLLSHGTQQLNAHREGVDEIWAKIYTEEAHLPSAPFLIHYHFASIIPCQRADDESGIYNNHQEGTNRHEESHESSHHTSTYPPWQRLVQSHQPIRTMHLSAHVNSNYSLTDFKRATLVPFSPRKDHWMLTFCAPQLMERYPSIWKRLENLELERGESIQAQSYRTELACETCGNSWGERLEELGQVFVLAKLECEVYKQKRDRRFQRIFCILTQLVRHLDEKTIDDDSHSPFTERHNQICYATHKMIIDHRGAPWMTRRQKNVMLLWESLIDQMCISHAEESTIHAEDGNDLLPWRHSGVYKNALCTDSVLGTEKRLNLKKLAGDHVGSYILWKEEPRYLEPFAYLAHNPGRFCLGPQEDPNHLQPQQQNRFRRRQRGFVTDMFMDDPICALQSALCVVSNPRSLMAHGIYDRVPYPGMLVRRPKLPSLPTLEQVPCNVQVMLQQVFPSPGKVVYYEVQNTLDLESLLLVNVWCDSQTEYKLPPHPISLHNYLRNIPPPGTGRYALSAEAPVGVWEEEEDVEIETRIEELLVEDKMVDQSLSQSDSETQPNHDGQQGNLNQNNFIGVHGPGLNNNHLRAPNARGPRLLNLLWVLSAHLGWTVDENHGTSSVYVDRRILIAAQWLSISLMVSPLFWTLFARYAQWVPTKPVDYTLSALPFTTETEMRFLTQRECGYASLLLLFSWLFLGRRIERYTSRDFFRAMVEHMSFDESNNHGLMKEVACRTRHWFERRWDAACPLFLQRSTFVPQWNRRNQNDVLRHVAFLRSRTQSEHRYAEKNDCVSFTSCAF